MNSFSFGLEVEICGKTYYIDMHRNGTDAARFEQIRLEVMTLAKTPADKDTMSKLIALVREYIDMALGEGAFDNIFAGRTPTLRDMVQLIKFLTEQLREANAAEPEVVEAEKRASVLKTYAIPRKVDETEEARGMLDEILDGMTPEQLAQMTLLAGAIAK